MIHRLLPADPTLSDRFLWLLHQLWDAMGYEWRRRGIPHPVQTAITFRTLTLWKRLRSVIAQWKAGTLRAPAEGRSDTSPRPTGSSPVAGLPQSGEGEESVARPPGEGGPQSVGAPRFVEPGSDWAKLLPRRAGWLRRLLPDSVPQMCAFIWMFDEAEMKAMIAEAPQQIGRVLRPLYALLGVPVPPELRLPKRVRVRAERKPLPPDPRAARFPDTPAGRSAARALARELAGLPVNAKRLSAEVYGLYVHPPRDDNCPPAKIGYGGRRRPLPKDYKPPKDEE